MSTYSIPIDKMIPVTEARRNLGNLLDRLPAEKEFFLMRGRKVAGKLIISDDARYAERMRVVKKAAGAWKGTDLDSDEFWHEILVKERIAGTKKKRTRL